MLAELEGFHIPCFNLETDRGYTLVRGQASDNNFNLHDLF